MIDMEKERIYTNYVSKEHVKQFSQFFTTQKIADFMASWVSKNAKKILDPSVGNSVFFKTIRKFNKKCKMKGYEIDSEILQYFGNPSKSEIVQNDYLTTDWEEKYDGIICNPPYNKFQSIKNRHEILRIINEKTGIKYSGYTNQYILFLAKSIHQMTNKGRLTYIIPSEFLNSDYGFEIKQQFIQQKLLRAVVNFQNNEKIFFNAVTTCCILFLDREEKDHVDFYSIEDINELTSIDIDSSSAKAQHISYKQLNAKDKWRIYLNNEEKKNYKNLTNFSYFCTVSRGIATGDNDFFCFSPSKAKTNRIPQKCFSKCICRSADIISNVFTEKELQKLIDSDKNVLLLDIDERSKDLVKDYIAEGIRRGVNQKYLTKTRKVWYSMEQKNVAPIWITTANRGGIKVVRNTSTAKTLTTFHSIFVNEIFYKYIDIIFCYLLTPIAQEILRSNRKELGNGLEKFQPGDLNSAKVVDFLQISKKDLERIRLISQNATGNIDIQSINELDKIFRSYVTN